jgi:hypothetical protein
MVIESSFYLLVKHRDIVNVDFMRAEPHNWPCNYVSEPHACAISIYRSLEVRHAVFLMVLWDLMYEFALQNSLIISLRQVATAA